jgi:hypothetical protein
MALELETCGFDGESDNDAKTAKQTRERFSQYLSANILLPDEVRCAQEILRRLRA